jgi:tetratricopeptide (TPR) repeat protein
MKPRSKLLHLLFALPLALIVNMSSLQASTAGDCYAGQLNEQRMAACTKIIEDPAVGPTERASALSVRALIKSLKSQFPEAISDLDQALALDPDSSQALNNRAWAMFKWKRSAEGMDDVERALMLEPNGAYIWDTRAHLRQVLGDFPGAIKDYEAAVGIGGEYFVKLYQCGLRERGLYHGPSHGLYSKETREALLKCASSSHCDPLPLNEFEEECDAATS